MTVLNANPDFFCHSIASNRLEPKLLLEGSSGCWWGEKHHYTCCGLNGSFIKSRGKTSECCYEEMVDVAYLFDTIPTEIVGTPERKLPHAVEEWSTTHSRSWLKYAVTGDETVILGARPAFPDTELVLADPFETELFRVLDQPRSTRYLRRSFVDETDHQARRVGRFLVPVRVRPAGRAGFSPDPGQEGIGCGMLHGE
ncbi:hypothetical protein J2S53_004016 [Actinopolyspora lacussalsi]|nr:hypothetical protein [Actinopolyspora lacussalsi]